MGAIDFQRKRCYDWEEATGLYENQWPVGPSLALPEAFATGVCRDYNVPNIPLVYRAGRLRGAAYGHAYIAMGSQIWAPRYVLHELAHGILHYRWMVQRLGTPELHHGPQFVALLMELRNRYLGDNIASMSREAARFGLIVSNNDAELDHLLALKNTTSDPDARKRIRKLIRAHNRRQLRAAGQE